jgi:hypothetical protein
MSIGSLTGPARTTRQIHHGLLVTSDLSAPF